MWRALAGRLAIALGGLACALALTASAPAPAPGATCAALLARAEALLGRRDPAVRGVAAQLAALGDQSGDPACRLWAHWLRAQIWRYIDGNIDAALLAAGEVLDEAERAGHREVALRAHVMVAEIAAIEDDFAGALEHQRIVLERQGADPVRRAQTLASIGVTYARMDDTRMALWYDAESRALAERLHLPALLVELDLNDCRLARRLGLAAEAQDQCQRALAGARHAGNVDAEAAALDLLASLGWDRRDYGECLRLAARGLALRAAIGDGAVPDGWLATTGLCHIDNGAPGRGEAEVERALAFYRRARNERYVGLLLGWMATAYERAGRYPQALAAQRELRRLNERRADRIRDSRVQRHRTALEARQRQQNLALLARQNRLQTAALRTERLWLAVGLLLSVLGLSLGYFAVRERERLRHQAQRDNLAKSRFVTAAAHELRQPMQAIGSLLGAAAHAAGRGEVGRTGELLGMARQAGDAMRGAFNAVLELSRLECGMVAADDDAFDLAELVAETVRALRPLSEPRGVAVRLRLPAGRRGAQAQVQVRSDRQLLGRVLRNLLSNAIKFSEPARPGGARVLVRVVASGRDCRVEIVDNGLGIPDGLQRQVFKPFFQVDNPGRERGRGIGLGLTIVASILTLLPRHRLTLRSVAGAGTRVRLAVPGASARQAKALAQRQHAAPDCGDLAGLYVLQVAGGPAERCEGAAVLGARGLLCDSAGSLAELARMLPGMERMPDLIVSDAVLADGMADDVRRAVSAEFGEAPPLIVVCAAGTWAREALRQAALDAAPAGRAGQPARPAALLCRPLPPAVLMSAVRLHCTVT